MVKEVQPHISLSILILKLYKNGSFQQFSSSGETNQKYMHRSELWNDTHRRQGFKVTSGAMRCDAGLRPAAGRWLRSAGRSRQADTHNFSAKFVNHSRRTMAPARTAAAPTAIPCR